MLIVFASSLEVEGGQTENRSANNQGRDLTRAGKEAKSRDSDYNAVPERKGGLTATRLPIGTLKLDMRADDSEA